MLEKLENRIKKLEKENKRLFYLANDAENKLFRVKSELEMLQDALDGLQREVNGLYD